MQTPWQAGQLAIPILRTRFVLSLLPLVQATHFSLLFKKVIKFMETAIVILQTGSVNPFLSIFEIPPLTPKTSLFDTEMAYPRLAPVFTFKYPEAVLSWCHKPMDWYYDDLSLPLYFDVLKSRETGDFVRCKLDIARDLSDVSLIPITNVTMK